MRKDLQQAIDRLEQTDAGRDLADTSRAGFDSAATAWEVLDREVDRSFVDDNDYLCDCPLDGETRAAFNERAAAHNKMLIGLLIDEVRAQRA